MIIEAILSFSKNLEYVWQSSQCHRSTGKYVAEYWQVEKLLEASRGCAIYSALLATYVSTDAWKFAETKAGEFGLPVMALGVNGVFRTT